MNQAQPSPSNAFLNIMQTHDAGEICNELADAMRECVHAVEASGKSATIEARQMMFSYHPVAPHLIIQDAVKGVLDGIREKLPAIPLFIGG